MINKRFLVFIICILISLFILYLLFFRTNSRSYVVFGDKAILQVENGNYKFVDYTDKLFSDKKFDVYDYNKYLGKYNIKYVDYDYLVYDEDETVSFDNALVGIYSPSNDVKLNTNSVEILKDGDIAILKKVLSSKNLVFDGILGVSEKRIVKCDNNDFYLYNVSYDDLDSDLLFSMIYILNNDDYNVLEFNSVDQDSIFDFVSYYVDSVVDLNDDGNDELIISTLVSSENESFSKKIYNCKNGVYSAF